MATFKFPKKLKVGKIDRYGINLEQWLGGDELTGLVITPPPNSGITVSSISLEEGVASGLFSATIVGTFDIEFEYQSGLRRDCVKVRLTTTAGC
jgi:hypothetical protein